MKLARTAIAFLFALSLVLAAFAHDGNEHVRGVVTAIGDTSITLETTDKKTATVYVDGGTKYENAGAKATLQDLTVGERAVIDIHRKDGKMFGSLVRFGSAKKAGAKQ